jgi:hypothetical protein
MKSLQQKFEELGLLNLKPYAPTQPVVARHLRKILKADVGHGYSAAYYIEYTDGTIEFQRLGTLMMDQTNVRLRNNSSSVWEERVSGAPGWFRCDDPTNLENTA